MVPIPLHPHNSLLVHYHLMAFVPAVLSAQSILFPDVLRLTSSFQQLSIQISHFRKAFPDQHSLFAMYLPYSNFLQNAYHILIILCIYLWGGLSVPVKDKSHKGRDSVCVFTTLSSAPGTLPRTQMFSKYLLNELSTGI